MTDTTTVPCWGIRLNVHDLDFEQRDKLSDAMFDLARTLDPSFDGVCATNERGCISCSENPSPPNPEEFWVGPIDDTLALLHACPGSDPDYGVAVMKFEDLAEAVDVLLAAMNNHVCKKPTQEGALSD